jgi:DNA-binding response OmpR family regulator
VKKILVIENDADTLELLGFLFAENEFKVLEYRSKVPVEQIIRDNPDLIVLDYYLDDGYGSDICIELKKNPKTRQVPVILLSTAIDLRQIAVDCCADAYLTKPFDIQNLEKMLSSLIA